MMMTIMMMIFWTQCTMTLESGDRELIEAILL